MPPTAQGQAARVPFVDRWHFQTDAVHARNVSSYQFLLDGDIGALQDYARRYFAEPSDGAVDLRPVSPHVLLQVSTAERLDGGDGTYPHSYPDLGTEHSAALLFFATDRNNDDAVVLVCPYLIVDNAISMMLAREAFGMPKNMGEVSVPAGKDDPNVISVRVLGVRDVTAPDARYEMQPLFEVTRAGGLEQQVVDLAHGLGDAFMRPGSGLVALQAGLIELFGLGELAAHSVGMLVQGEFRMLCLKQFRDHVDNTLASYQQVVALRSKIERRDGFRPLLGHYQVDFTDVSSHPIAKDLGLRGVVDSRLSFWMGYEFSITGEAYP